ncbi:MAG: hypothetical protein QNJ00_08450 [Woeseiaceae bacterium]|nr:hypothetical protein [Woeseiaceae bacterium]
MSTSLAIFIIAVVTIGCATGLISDWIKMRRKEMEHNQSAGDYEAQIEALEERIRVLERIVTEKKYDLKREISEL